MVKSLLGSVKATFGRAGIAVAFLLFTVSFVGSGAAAPRTTPITIGVLAPLSGPLASIGPAMRDGIEFYFKQHGYEIAGRPVKLIVEDTESDVAKGLTKVRKLVERDQASVLAGFVHSGVALAARDYIDRQGIPTVIAVAGIPELTQAAKSPHIFRVVRSFGQGDAVGGWYAFHKLGWRKITMFYLDYAAGHAAAAGFKKSFVAAGGQVVEELKPPLGTSDFAPFLSKISASAGKIDGVWAYVVGADAIRLIKSYAEFGLKGRVKLFANAEIFSQAILAPQGKDAVGHLSYSDENLYAGLARRAPETLQFMSSFRNAYGREAGSLESHGYVAAEVIAAAAKAVSGDIENREAFENALRKVRFKSVEGREFAFDPNQGGVVDVVIQSMTEQQGRVTREFGEIIPDVDQFWKPK